MTPVVMQYPPRRNKLVELGSARPRRLCANAFDLPNPDRGAEASAKAAAAQQAKFGIWVSSRQKSQTRLEDGAILPENHLMALRRVCSKSELSPGQARRIEDPPVAVFNANGTFFAIRDVCTHEGAPLSEGEVVEEETVVCPWHGACFSLRTGEALTPPAIEPVETYPVVLREDDIYVDVQANDK